MDSWKGISGLSAIGKTLMILPGNDILTCGALRVSNVYSSTRVSRQLWQKPHSQKVAYVSVCWQNTAIDSTLFHYHSLPMLAHL
jgi:hypothetical protein